MTPLAVFEELRFILELLVSEWLFFLPFTRRREGFWRNVLVGVPAFCLLSQMYFLIYNVESSFPYPLYRGLIVFWYIFLSLLTIWYAYLCFHVTVSDAFFFCTAGYAVQHLIYVISREWIARMLFPQMPDSLPVYILVTLFVTAVVLCVVYLLFAGLLQDYGEQLISDSPRSLFSLFAIFSFLMLSSFLCQALFENVPEARGYAVALDLLVCMLILEVQIVTLIALRFARERTVINQMLRESQMRFGMTREMVDRINRTCHDLKHNLEVLKTIDSSRRWAYIEETETDIERYQQMVFSENEILNTILAEKSIYCQNRNIRLTCAVDGASLDHISLPDLYALLGNAIDNAVEYVARLEDPEKRQISLTIRSQGGIVSIQTNNICLEKLETEDGLPVTTKKDRYAHGFGLKSIRYIAEKYGGAMTATVENNVFILQVMLPGSVPADSA